MTATGGQHNNYVREGPVKHECHLRMFESISIWGQYYHTIILSHYHTIILSHYHTIILDITRGIHLGIACYYSARMLSSRRILRKQQTQCLYWLGTKML